MSVTKTFLLIVIFCVLSSCATNKKIKTTNDDYEIINLLFNKYTDTIFFNDAKTLFKVYEDSMMLNNQFRTEKFDKTKKEEKLIYKYINTKKIQNSKLIVVSDDAYNYKIDYPKTPFNPKPDKHKFIIKELYYNDTKTEAFLNYYEVVYTPIYGTVWDNTRFEMRYKKENGKWIELGNFNRKLH